MLEPGIFIWGKAGTAESVNWEFGNGEFGNAKQHSWNLPGSEHGQVWPPRVATKVGMQEAGMLLTSPRDNIPVPVPGKHNRQNTGKTQGKTVKNSPPKCIFINSSGASPRRPPQAPGWSTGRASSAPGLGYPGCAHSPLSAGSAPLGWMCSHYLGFE